MTTIASMLSCADRERLLERLRGLRAAGLRDAGPWIAGRTRRAGAAAPRGPRHRRGPGRMSICWHDTNGWRDPYYAAAITITITVTRP